MVGNPSEIMRLEVEREYLIGNLEHGYHSKSTKQYLLDQIHDIERRLGIPLYKYNGNTKI